MDPDYQSRKPKHKFREFILRNKLLAIIVVFVLLVCVGVGGWLYYLNHLPTAAEKQAQQTKLINDTVAEVQKSVSSGKQVDAIKIIDNAVKATDDTKTKGYLLMEKSNTYFNDKNYDQALLAALASELYNKTSDNEEFIAKIYVEKNDYKNAIIYYQKAIELVDKTSPMGSAYIQDYQNRIDLLSGTKK